MMKIAGFAPAPLSAPRPVRPAGARGRFSVAADPAGESAEARESAALDPVSIAPSLLALQETMTAGERDARARRRAEGMLEELAQLQLGLLSGRLPRARLESLAALASEPEMAADPGLAAIAAEIGVRAAVELARLDAIAAARRAE
ncbi:flagellar assembly protein FliX [Elioraea sp.]|uniref:flagellar assembly protein FliX n=1 Tax=Elioraea sp. TaxID=2185103 RepID=UPI00307DCE51